jgi:hypothetical protein
MSESFETMLEERFAALAGSDEAPDWSDVVARSVAYHSRARRRAVLLTAIAATAALAAAPAFGLRGHLVRLFSERKPAPVRVDRSFRVLDRGAPFKRTLAAAARKVLDVPTPDGHVVLWAAPVHAGGFCLAVGMAGRAGEASWCDGDRSATLDPWPYTWPQDEDELVGGPAVLVGYALDRKAALVEVRFDDGERTRVPLTWISPPIDAGFFVVWTARKHWLDGKERFDVVARDAAGTTLDEAAIELGVPIH